MPWCLRLQICTEIFDEAESVPCVYISSKSQHLENRKTDLRFRVILCCKIALEIFVQFESVPCIYILQIAKSSNSQSCDSVVPVPETSERWVLDPMNNPWVDLCHQFRTTCCFGCVWMCLDVKIHVCVHMSMYLHILELSRHCVGSAFLCNGCITLTCGWQM